MTAAARDMVRQAGTPDLVGGAFGALRGNQPGQGGLRFAFYGHACLANAEAAVGQRKVSSRQSANDGAD